MMEISLRSLVAGIVISMLIACQADNRDSDDDLFNPQRDITIGQGSFIFDGYNPLRSKPLEVFYFNPSDEAGGVAELPIMILMHGNSRAAESYRNAMSQFALKYNFLLIVPEFSTDYFPSSRDYHQGGILTEEGEQVDEEYWAFSLIEPLFDHIREDTDNRNENYILYGFSAGSQFVHRFMMHKPDNRAERIVSASAGTYSMPDNDIEYSYGLKNTTVTEEALANFYQRDVTIMTGEADTVRSRSDLVKTPEADRQGWDRVERGKEFFQQSQYMADSLSTPFNWKFKTAPGVGHSQSEMAEDAAKEIFEN